MRIALRRGAVALVFGASAAGIAAIAGPAAAVPAFAVQTGEPCQACHVGGFGPQLTAFGREFKLQGYTLRAKNGAIPLSVMAVASYIRTAKAQDPPPAAGFGTNDNLALDQISLFLAGGLGRHFGAFVQGTYDGVAKAWHWDNLDLRAVTTAKLGRHDVVLGATLNNAPTVEDAWNTLPAWGFPYTSSTPAPHPPPSPLLNGALAQTSLGASGYAWINGELYLEGGVYWSPGAGALTGLGVDPTVPGSIKGVAPYGRIAVQRDVGPGVLEVGAFGLRSEIHPGLDQLTGLVDRYTDVGVDGSYIVPLRRGDTLTLNARFVHESQALDATCALAGVTTGCADNSLDDVRIDGSFYWRNEIGLTLAAFDTTGSANPILYAGNRTFRPNSTGLMAQLDGTPWGSGRSPLGPRFNTRVGMQYIAYTRFNGARDNWDGMGSNAGDNNTLRVFIWSAF
ncbi:MAG: hypothetical protein JOZ27_06855 [Caulobacteraceae bacterium]|nr:hypothetical protein [Caulobacteraceae bacterium]